MTILRAGGPEGPAASMVSAVLQRRMKRWWARSILSPSLISAFHLQCSSRPAEGGGGGGGAMHAHCMCCSPLNKARWQHPAAGVAAPSLGATRRPTRGSESAPGVRPQCHARHPQPRRHLLSRPCAPASLAAMTGG